MDQIITNFQNLTIFGFTWFPALIIYWFIIISVLSIIMTLIKKSFILLILVIAINILAWLWIFEIINNAFEK